MKRKKVIIIAEGGVNHNGSIVLAKKLVDAAADAGADYIKFQTFNASKLVTEYAEKAQYQKKNTRASSQLSMLKKLELSENDHRTLIKYAAQRKIKFLSTPFDDESILLLKKLKIKVGKIPSGEITSFPYLKKMASAFPEIILSTGMSTLPEVKSALSVLYKYGVKKKNITLLHCTTEYPASMEHINLLAMQTMEKSFGLPVGYSDHTNGTEVPVAAVAMGAVLIEKHLTTNKKLKGPDHKASLEPNKFKQMVTAIRNVERALGSSEKKPVGTEGQTKLVARKSIVAAVDIKKGEVFTERNITIKRPGNGLSPMLWEKVIGRKAKSNFVKNEQIIL